MNQPKVNDDQRLAFHTAQFELFKDAKGISKDESNPFFKSKYVALPKLLEYLKPLCEKHGFILEQPIEVANSQTGIVNVVTTRIIHVATGLSSASQMVLAENSDPQKAGGNVTYFRRYTATALFGLPELDDDGNSASGKVAPKRKISKSDDF